MNNVNKKIIIFLVMAITLLPLFQIPNAHAATLFSNWFNGSYQNNEIWDYSTNFSSPNYGTHDWIADHAMNLLPSYERIWIQKNYNAFLLGTEAPDNASLDYLGTNTGYGDFSQHVVNYGSSGNVTNDAAARRAQEEYNKAATNLPWNEQLGAYYAGSMIHYISDVAVFAHVMGGSSFLGNASHHAEFERGVETYTKSYNGGKFEKYIVAPSSLSEATAYDSALQVGKVTTFGYGNTKPAAWMNSNFPLSGDTWNVAANAAYTDSVGDSLYRAVVASAKVLHTLATHAGYTLERIPQNGTTRYDTAVGISQKVFPTAKTASSVVLVSATSPTDAIIAGPFAKQKNGVVLFTDTSAIPSVTLNEVQRLLANTATSHVYILGGTESVGSAVETYIDSHFSYTVTRLGSSSRYQTSADVANAMNFANSAFLTQTNAVDGIAAAGVAARDGRPMLITAPDALSSEVSDFLTANPKGIGMNTIYILGGTGAVSDAVATTITGMGKTVVRIAGATDRFDTARAIADAFYVHPTKIVVANGYSMVDAVVGSVLAARYAAPILLSTSTALPAVTQDYIDDNASTLSGGYILGGTGAVSYQTERVAGVHM